MSAVINIWGLPGGASIYSNLLSYGLGSWDTPFGHYRSNLRSNQIYISRKPDKYSTMLHQMVLNADSIGLIKITATYTDEEGYLAKGSMIFSDSVISSVNISGKAQPVESISFYYSSMKVEYSY